MSPTDPHGTPEDGAADMASSAEPPTPDPADFQAPDLPRGPINKILVIAAVLVLALIVALGVVTWLTIRDEPSNATHKPTALDTDQITSVITDFIDYTNSGHNTRAQDLMCSEMAVLADIGNNAPASNPARVEKITGVQIKGDTATAIVTTSARSTLSAEEGVDRLNTMTMDFRNESGWKICSPVEG